MKINLIFLEVLFKTYLHQDYDLMSDNGTIDSAVSEFMDNLSIAELRSFNDELEYLMNNPVEDWENLFYTKLGLEYNYHYDWPSALDWLQYLRNKAACGTNKTT